MPRVKTIVRGDQSCHLKRSQCAWIQLAAMVECSQPLNEDRPPPVILGTAGNGNLNHWEREDICLLASFSRAVAT